MKDRSNRPVVGTAVAEAKKVKQTKISLVWLVPIVAAACAAYLIFDRVKAAGPVIKISFMDGSGIQANQTTLRYRGVRIGKVSSVKLSGDSQRVEVAASLDRQAARLASEGSVFWIVRPEVSAGGFRGLDTLVSGPFIQVEPGQGREQKMFIGSEETPVVKGPPGSLDVVVTTPHVGTLNTGAPVYYRGLEVGTVQRLLLNEDATKMNIHVQIQPEYASLVRQNTEFWNAGGLDVSLKLFGIKVSAESMRALIVGGIAFATPPSAGLLATSNNVFVLHEKPEEKWLAWAPPMPGWAGTNDPGATAPSQKSALSVSSLTTNRTP